MTKDEVRFSRRVFRSVTLLTIIMILILAVLVGFLIGCDGPPLAHATPDVTRSVVEV